MLAKGTLQLVTRAVTFCKRDVRIYVEVAYFIDFFLFFFIWHFRDKDIFL